MKPIIDKLARTYIHLKSRKVLKRIDTILNFPIRSKEVKNVLIVFPRELDHLDDANQFVQKLREGYRSWSVEIFDVDKLSQKELNILKLPNQTVIHKLKKPNYEIVIDLNVPFDPVCAFIAVLSEATYRIKFTNQEQLYFNLQCSPAQDNHRFFYQPLLDYLQSLFMGK